MAGKILVIGAGGRLGQALMAGLSGEHAVEGVDRQALELRSRDAIQNFLESRNFSHLLVPAALTAVDYCETNEEEAFAINAKAPGELARICRERGAKVVLYSTDFVFDGRKTEPYVEDDPAAPLSVYGASKLEGECRVLEASEQNLVIRLAWVFGPDRAGFPEWIVDQAKQRNEISLPGDKIGSPTFTRDVADWTASFLPGGRLAEAGGIYHLSNSGSCSWAEWGTACLEGAQALGVELKTAHISPGALSDVKAFEAERPKNSALDTRKFQKQAGTTPRSWKEAVRAHFNELYNSKCRAVVADDDLGSRN